MKSDAPLSNPSNDQDTKPEKERGAVSRLLGPRRYSLGKALYGVTVAAVKAVARAGSAPARDRRKTASSADRQAMIKEAGAYLRDLREVAGLTVRDLSRATKLEDQSFLSAVESGTATLSFELILRLSALVARHDPIPFVIKMTRTYNPEIWAILEDWGIGGLPIQIERERHFVNVYRSRDAARQLSDKGFDKVLNFTRAAFEMGLYFAAKEENIPDDVQPPKG